MASRTLTLKSLTLEQNGAYSCLVKNAIGEYQSHPLIVHMKCKDYIKFRKRSIIKIAFEWTQKKTNISQTQFGSKLRYF